VISISVYRFGAASGDLEVLGLVLDDPLRAILVGDTKRVPEGVVDRLEEPLPLLERPPFHDLDPYERHRT
jgi:hypothetical protein